MWFRVFSSCPVLDPSLARRPGKEGLLQLQEHWESSSEGRESRGDTPVPSPLWTKGHGAVTAWDRARQGRSRNTGRTRCHHQSRGVSPPNTRTERGHGISLCSREQGTAQGEPASSCASEGQGGREGKILPCGSGRASEGAAQGSAGVPTPQKGAEVALLDQLRLMGGVRSGLGLGGPGVLFQPYYGATERGRDIPSGSSLVPGPGILCSQDPTQPPGASERPGEDKGRAELTCLLSDAGGAGQRGLNATAKVTRDSWDTARSSQTLPHQPGGGKTASHPLNIG